MDIVNLLLNFESMIISAAQKNEPAIIARYLIELAQKFSVFYNNNRIIGEEEKIQNTRLYLTYMVNEVLKKGLNLMGIEVPDKM